MSAYFAVVQHDEGGVLVATVPDLPGLVTQANGPEELDAMLRDAVGVYLEGLDELKQPHPAASSYADILAQGQHEEDFAFVTLVTVPDVVERVRVNIRVPVRDLELIDRAAAARQVDRSAFLIQSAKAVALGTV